MKHRARTIQLCRLTVALLCITWSIPAVGQVTYGSFRGRVTDPSGAPVPSVTLTATSRERGFIKTVQADSDGSYEIPSLLEGTYTLTAEAQGFKKYVNEGLVLFSRDQRRVDINLELGAVTEQISVTGQAALVDTESASISTPRPESWQIFRPGNRARSGMPQFELFQLAQQGHYNEGGFSWVNHGSHGLEMRASHDGMEVDNLGNFRAPQFSFVETKIHLVNSPAEFQTSGTAQAVTRGGSNEFHGALLMQYENWALNALGPNARARPPGVPATQFEGMIGGPVVIPKLYNGRNRTFWHFVTRQTRSNTANFPLYVFPQPAMRNGDLSIYPRTITDPTTGTPFPGNQIPVSRISPISTKLLSMYVPLPNRGNPNNLSDNFVTHKPEKTDQRDYNFRADQKIGENNTLSVILFRLQNVTTGDFDQIPGDGPYHVKGGARSIAIQDTHTFSPSVVNDFGFSRINIFGDSEYGSISGIEFLQSIGLTNLGGRPLPEGPGAPRINIPGFGHLAFFGSNLVGANQGVRTSNDIRYILRDNVSFHRGRHVFKTGFSMQKYIPNSLTVGGNAWGTYNFSGFASGNEFADFLLGIPNTTAITRPRGEIEESHSEVGLYFQDEFKMTPRVTWSLGLRYQLFTVPIDKNGQFYNFDVARMQVVVRDAEAKAAVHPAYPQGIPIVTAEQAGYPSNLVPNWKGGGWEPRIGVAWRPWSNNFVVRSGFGVYHVPTVPGFALAGREGGPFQLNESFGPNVLTNGVPNTTLSNPFPTGPGQVGAQNLLSLPAGYKIPYTMQWNLTLEGALFGGFTGRVSYVGSKGTQWRYLANLSQPFPSTLPYSPALRPIQPTSLYNNVRLAQNGGNMTYHALEWELSRKFSKGLYFAANFNWNKTLVDVTQAGAENGLNLTNTYNRSMDKGRADSSEPLLLTANMVWELPFGRGKRFANLSEGGWNSFLNHIIGGWRYSVLFVASSGQLFTPTYTGFDATGTGITSGRPDALCNDQEQKDVTRWWNAACFAIPSTTGTSTGAPLGRFGTAPRGMLRGPAYYSDEMGIFKDFHLTPKRESLVLRLAVLANNSVNHPVMGGLFGCNTNVTSPAFGNCPKGNPSWWAYPGRHVWLTGQIVF